MSVSVKEGKVDGHMLSITGHSHQAYAPSEKKEGNNETLDNIRKRTSIHYKGKGRETGWPGMGTEQERKEFEPKEERVT